MRYQRFVLMLTLLGFHFFGLYLCCSSFWQAIYVSSKVYLDHPKIWMNLLLAADVMWQYLVMMERIITVKIPDISPAQWDGINLGGWWQMQKNVFDTFFLFFCIMLPIRISEEDTVSLSVKINHHGKAFNESTYIQIFPIMLLGKSTIIVSF